MLGIGGKFASSKGMVAMPNLANLSRTQAIQAIQDAGLKISNSTPSTTSNQSDNDKVFQQSITAGQLVDYETAISFNYYNYVAPPAPSGPTIVEEFTTDCVPYETYEISRDCNSTTKIGTVTYGFKRHSVTTYRYSDGSYSTVTNECNPTLNPDTKTIYNCDGSLDCNSYLRTYSETLPASQCSSGYARYTIGVFREGCGKSNVQSFDFCTSNPNAVDCGSCVSSYTYRTSDSNCASGTAWRQVCTHPAGCSPAQTDAKGGCDPVVETVCRTSCTPWYYFSCGAFKAGLRRVTRRCSDCNGNNEYRESYDEPC